MKIRSNLRPFAGILLLLVGYAFTLPYIQRPTQAAPPAHDVNVVNTTANPVPTTLVGTSAISGNVSVVNTPTVNAQQSGAWTVGITGMPSVSIVGTPTVSLAAGGGVSVANSVDANGNPIPLLIRDADNGARQPFVTSCGGLTAVPAQGQTAGGGVCKMATVPDGKRFVIEVVTGFCTTPSGNKVGEVGFNPPLTNLLMTPTGFSANGFDEYAINVPLRLYVDPGATPQFVFFSNDNSGSTACFFNLSGYLVNL
jgi:hypothetical protein